MAHLYGVNFIDDVKSLILMGYFIST